jgi:4'-phosphopantetheinyl transferase
LATSAPPGGELLPAPPGVDLLWLGSVGELAGDALAHRDVLDKEELRRLGAFLRPADRDAFAVAHVALRRFLGRRLGLAPHAVELGRDPCSHCGGPHGRPVVPCGSVHFSLSHTSRTGGGMVLIALAPVPVGADIEAVPATATVGEVAGQLHPRERRELDALPGSERPLAFARCWTRKEALLKGTGAGLGDGLTEIYTGTGPLPARPVMAPVDGGAAARGARPEEGTDSAERAWAVSDVPVPPEYAAAVAVPVDTGAVTG